MSSRPLPTTKTVLGRGLDQLITGTQTCGQAGGGEPSASTIKVDVRIGAGLSALLRSADNPARLGDAETKGSCANRAFFSHHLVLSSSLAAADLLLVSQTTMHVWRHAPTMELAEWTLAFMGIGFGAWLGCLAVLLFVRENR